jgi:hypothetical protein
MIPIPWRLEPNLTPEDFQKIGQLAVRWSHTDHLIGNCLKTILRLSDDEAMVIVFPMNTEARLNRITELNDVNPLNEHAQDALNELKPIMKGIQFVRNNVIHAFVSEDTKGGHLFHLTSKDRTLTKAEIFSAEDITNYAGHLALALRLALGIAGASGHSYAWPDRPEIPNFLRSVIQFPKK